MKLICDTIKMIKNKPKLIVFDLDSTLWALGKLNLTKINSIYLNQFI